MNNGLDVVSFLQVTDKYMLETNGVQKKQFELFYNLLVEWNLKINLISRNEKNVVDRHFLNSACIAHFVKFNSGDRIVDLGSGGGFPGIILKILFPQSYFILIDSVRKKTDFLKLVISELELQNIDVVNDRIEKISSSNRYSGSFDYVSARAVSPLKELICLSQPFLKKNGKMFFLKGRSYADEIPATSIKPEQLKIHALNPIAETQDGVLLIISAD